MLTISMTTISMTTIGITTIGMLTISNINITTLDTPIDQREKEVGQTIRRTSKLMLPPLRHSHRILRGEQEVLQHLQAQHAPLGKQLQHAVEEGGVRARPSVHSQRGAHARALVRADLALQAHQVQHPQRRSHEFAQLLLPPPALQEVVQLALQQDQHVELLGLRLRQLHELLHVVRPHHLADLPVQLRQQCRVILHLLYQLFQRLHFLKLINFFINYNDTR